MLFIVGSLFGFSLYYFLSNPKKFKSKMPQIKIGRLVMFPIVIIPLGKYQLHIHHWLYLTILLVIAFFYLPLGYHWGWIIKGFVAGGVVQGFCYKDRFKLLE